jgi:hypothetical protein
MSRDAAVRWRLSQAFEIACAAVRCGGSCGGLRRFPKSRVKSRCGGSAAVAAWCPPYPLCASQRFRSAPRAQGSREVCFLGYPKIASRARRPLSSRLEMQCLTARDPNIAPSCAPG